MGLSAKDVAGAIAELSRAVSQLAHEADVPSVHRRTELSDTEELEISRLQLSHPRLLRQDTAVYPEGDFRESSAAAEILRLTAMHPREFGARVSRGPGRPTARSRRDAQTLALSASGSGGTTLVSKWGLPVTVAGVPVTSENAGRLGLGSVLPPMVVDVTDEPAQDISSWVGRQTGAGLGDGADPDPDLGVTDPSFGKQSVEYLNSGAVADPAAEIGRLVQAGAAAGVTGLRTGASKNRHPGTGRFTSKQARLTGTLTGI